MAKDNKSISQYGLRGPPWWSTEGPLKERLIINYHSGQCLDSEGCLVSTTNQVFPLDSKRLYSKGTLIWQNRKWDDFSSATFQTRALSSRVTAFQWGVVALAPRIEMECPCLLASFQTPYYFLTPKARCAQIHVCTHMPHLLRHSLLLISPLFGGFSNTNAYQSIE